MFEFLENTDYESSQYNAVNSYETTLFSDQLFPCIRPDLHKCKVSSNTSLLNSTDRKEPSSVCNADTSATCEVKVFELMASIDNGKQSFFYTQSVRRNYDDNIQAEYL